MTKPRKCGAFSYPQSQLARAFAIMTQPKDIEVRAVDGAPMRNEAWLAKRLQEQAAAVRADTSHQRSSINGIPTELFEGEIVRELTPADMLERQTNGADTLAAEPYKLKRLRYSHHTLARLLAEGTLTQVEISAQTGYSEATITSYKRDPTFRELVRQYQEEYKGRGVDVVDKLETLAIDVLMEIATRLEEAPESVSMAQLLEASKLLLDRSGYGPISKQLNVNANVSPETLARIKENVEAEEKRRIDLATTKAALPASNGAESCILEGRVTSAEITEIERQGGSGQALRNASSEEAPSTVTRL